MGALTIASFPRGREFLAGESLLVHTIFHNAADAPCAVPSPDAPSPFRYVLAPAEGGAAYHLSLDDFATLLRNFPPDRRGAPETRALAPGARLGRWEDVAELSGEPFAPGRYALTTRYDAGGVVASSPPAPLTVVAPRIEAAASAYCVVRGSLASALAHRAADGVVVLARESYRRRPELGVFRRVAALPGDAPVGDLRVFVDTADIVGGRWLAWVRDGRVAARRAWGPTVETALDDVAPPWSRLRLAAPGFQRADASGLLLVAGEAGGQGRAAAVRLAPDGARVLWELALGDAPEDLRASHGPDGRVWLVWTARGEVRALAFHPDDRPRDGDVRALLALGAPCVGWSVPAVARTDAPVVTVLEGPTERRALRVHAVPLGEGARTTIALGPVPDGVARWDVLPHPDGALLFAAVAGRLYVTRADGAEDWRELGRVDPAAGWFQVWSAEGAAPWAEWDDPALGLRRAPVPP